MTFRQFEVFKTVARHRNITKAARELHTSQPSISKHLKNLEDTYATRLFTRSGKGVALTSRGAEFLSYVEPILSQLEVIKRHFVTDRTPFRATPLTLGGTHVLSATILPLLLRSYHERYPTVPIILRSKSTSALEEMVIKGKLELALVSGAPAKPELMAEQCVPLRLIAFASKRFRVLPETHGDLRKLQELPLIVRGGDSAQHVITNAVLEGLRKNGYKPKIVMECESPESVKMAVKEGLGVGILYEQTVKKDIAVGTFKRLRIPGASCETNSYVIYDRQRSLSSNAEAFLTLLKNWCAARKSNFARPSERYAQL